ncbi:MAG: hypothetical protein RPU61_03450 [Candidatus Sedimenticola sp. (ex Thyasira tokunagai)]
MLVSHHRRRALHTVFAFLGSTLGALEIVENFDDLLERKWENM